MSDAAPPQPFTFAEDDKPAIAALMVRYSRWWRSRDRDQKVKAAIDERLAQYDNQFAQLKSAFALFGITGFASADWIALRDALGEDFYYATLAKVPEKIPLPECAEWASPAPVPTTTIPLDQLLGQFLGATPSPDASATVREIAIEKLREAGIAGLKAGDLRKYIEDLRKTTLHEKTVGMTLYRLSQEGLARREGRTWFYVEPSGETQNPAGETAGPINRDSEKGEEP